jgi:hypothetical protein
MAQPEKIFRQGCCSASVFKNSFVVNGKEIEKKKVVPQKSYKDKEGDWKHTNSFDEQDMPKMILAMQKAYDYVTTKESPI